MFFTLSITQAWKIGLIINSIILKATLNNIKLKLCPLLLIKGDLVFYMTQPPDLEQKAEILPDIKR